MDFVILELSLSASMEHEMHVHKESLGACDAALGRDLLEKLGIDINFSEMSIK